MQATKDRLAAYLDKNNMSAAEFVRTAMQLSKDRNLLGGWAKQSNGQSAISRFLNYKNSRLTIRNRELVDATLNFLETDGVVNEPEYITEETLLNILENFRVQVENEVRRVVKAESNGSSSLKKQYAELLLKSELPLDEAMVKRLDKLVGV